MSHFSIGIAWRYTRANKKSGLLSFLSTISMAGLVVGVSLLVVVLSVMNGFERELRERILGLMPQASLYRAGGIENWPELDGRITQMDSSVIAAPFVQVSALLSYRGQTEPVLIYGIDIEQERKISKLSEYVETSALDAVRAAKNRILLGAELAEALKVKQGASLMVLSPSKSSSGSARIIYLELAGLIRSNSELDRSLVIASIDGLDTLRVESLAGKVDGLKLRFDDLDQAPSRAANIAFGLGPEFYQTNWQQTHGNLYHAIKTSKTMVGLLMSMIVALAAFNVVSTLILVVTEKRASIAILRTLGASSRDILKIFVTQGLIIGAAGVALGVLLGIGLVSILEPLVGFAESTLHVQFLHSDVYPLTDIPTDVQVSDLVQITSTAMVLVFFATIFPAWTASRLQPAKILRYE